MYQKVEIVVEGFCLGTNLVPKGSIIEVNKPAHDYLLREGKAVDAMGEDEQQPGLYSRRDMQAKNPIAKKPRRRRRTKAEMEAARKAEDNSNLEA